MEKQKRKEQGITLIALVVTIVVLLILAAISIGMLTGENGIITQAQKSREETIIADEKEILSLSYTSCKQENMINDMFEENVTDEQLQTELDNNRRNTTVILAGNDLEVIFNDTSHKYVIYQDGTIEQVENLSPEEANKIVDAVAFCESGIYVLTAEGKVKLANVIEGNIFDTLEVEENAETITRNGVKEKGYNYFIDNKGKVYTWGDNGYGQLGDGTTTDSSVPICISDKAGNILNGKNIEKMYSDGPRVIALDIQGKVYTWGANWYGQLGDGTTTKSSVPICISDKAGNALNGKNITEVYGGDSVIALDNQGKVYTWGYNRYGQLGDGTTTNSSVPICISDKAGNALNGKNIEKVYNDGYTVIALNNQGKVYTWGYNRYGQLGDGSTTNSSVPICISDKEGNALNGKNIEKMYSNRDTVIALDNQGKVYTWGYNWYGQLGDGSTTNSSVPICISDKSGNALNGKNITEVYGGSSVIALDNQGKVYTWGYNGSGQLGDGSTTNSSVPICISDKSGNALNGKIVEKMYSDGDTVIALDNQGKVYTWGDNWSGQLGDGTTTDSSVPICISDKSGNALNGKNIEKMYSDGYTVIALDNQGKVYTWGNNWSGQLGDGTTTNSSVPICISNIEGSEIYGDEVRIGGYLDYNFEPEIGIGYMLYYISESNQIYCYFVFISPF